MNKTCNIQKNSSFQTGLGSVDKLEIFDIHDFFFKLNCDLANEKGPPGEWSVFSTAKKMLISTKKRSQRSDKK